MKTLTHQLDDARGRCAEALGYLSRSESDPALFRIIEDVARRIGKVRRELSAGTHRYDARDLSCQGLTLVDPGVLTFHGYEVVGFAEEMQRRGEIHVYGCDVIGHLPRLAESGGCMSCDPGSPPAFPPICLSCVAQGVTLDALKSTPATK